jgi:tetrahydromethanopterin:alpha-L-glutamate ligase
MPRSDRLAAGAGPTVLLVSDQNDWHARRMQEAYTARRVRVQRVDLADCGFATQSQTGLDLGVLRAILPDAVHVRTMSAGSFEAITKRLGVLHALRQLGVPVWNDAQSIERCVDKSMTSFLLARAGLATPPTWTIEGAAQAQELVARELADGPLVLKPLFGAQGKGLRLLRRADDLPPPEAIGGVYYLQRFVAPEASAYHDFRLLVVGGRVAAAMMRTHSMWITNIKQGGKPSAFSPDPGMARLAVRAAEVVGASIAGVDILVGADGSPSVLEVNSMPAWSGLQKVTPFDIAGLIAESLIETLASRGRIRTAS